MLLGTTIVEVTARGPVPAKVLLAAVMLAWLYLLFKGIRWVWIGTIGIYVLATVPEVISGSFAWTGVALSVIGFLLLILPVTRQHFFDSTAAAVGRP
jgi:hypothetical protein